MTPEDSIKRILVFARDITALAVKADLGDGEALGGFALAFALLQTSHNLPDATVRTIRDAAEAAAREINGAQKVVDAKNLN